MSRDGRRFASPVLAFLLALGAACQREEPAPAPAAPPLARPAPEGCESIHVVHAVTSGLPPPDFTIEDGETLAAIHAALQALPPGRVSAEDEGTVQFGAFQLVAQGEGCGFDEVWVWNGWVFPVWLDFESPLQDVRGLEGLLVEAARRAGLYSAPPPESAPYFAEVGGGPLRRGVYPGATPIFALAGERWRVRVGGGEAYAGQPIAANDLAFFGAYGDLLAVELASGRERWRFPLKSKLSAAPTAWKDTLYVVTKESRLYAFDARSGALRWDRRLQPREGSTLRALVFTAPVVTDDTIYVAANDGVHALAREDGAPRWHFAEELLRATPTVFRGRLYFGGTNDGFFALDASSGDLLWRREIEGDVLDAAALWDGVLYFGSSDGHVYALEAAGGALRWRFRTGGRVHGAPAVADGVVYAGSLDGKVYALDASSGARLWAWQTGSEIQNAPAIAGGVLYVRSYDGHLYAFDRSGAGPFPEDTGRLLWSYQTRSPWGTAPVPVPGADGLVLFGAEQTIHALEGR